jgi:hypothetical protein
VELGLFRRGRPGILGSPYWIGYPDQVLPSTGQIPAFPRRAVDRRNRNTTPTVMPKIITAADLSKFIEGSLGLAATVAQDTVKLLFRGCERALASGGAGETLGIGLRSTITTTSTPAGWTIRCVVTWSGTAAQAKWPASAAPVASRPTKPRSRGRRTPAGEPSRVATGRAGAGRSAPGR